MQVTPKQQKNKLVVLVGPTAVGKTACSVELAAKINGEIISGDSMQFYRYIDIGTAKILPQEMISKNGIKIPHHLIDILNPDQPYSVADFQRDTCRLVEEINQRGHIPIIAGGTGLYVSAVVDGYTLQEQAQVDEAFRKQKKQEFEANGGAHLLAELAQVDPETAGKLEANDCKRIIRALEVYRQTGVPMSQQANQNPPDWDIAMLGLSTERQFLYQRIDQRVLKMIDNGLVEEVKKLLAMGYGPNLKPMQGLGYKQICMYLAGEITLDEATALIQRDTRRFAKRQLTWWRRDNRICWFDPRNYQDIQQLTEEMLRQLPW